MGKEIREKGSHGMLRLNLAHAGGGFLLPPNSIGPRFLESPKKGGPPCGEPPDLLEDLNPAQ